MLEGKTIFIQSLRLFSFSVTYVNISVDKFLNLQVLYKRGMLGAKKTDGKTMDLASLVCNGL